MCIRDRRNDSGCSVTYSYSCISAKNFTWNNLQSYFYIILQVTCMSHVTCNVTYYQLLHIGINPSWTTLLNFVLHFTTPLQFAIVKPTTKTIIIFFIFLSTNMCSIWCRVIIYSTICFICLSFWKNSAVWNKECSKYKYNVQYYCFFHITFQG